MSAKKLLARLAYLVCGGAVTLLFLMVAQVNLDDLRLKAGHLRIVPDPVLEVGGFYTIHKNGRINGPHCKLDDQVFEAYYDEQASPIVLSNKLGSSLPFISRWTMSLLNFLGLPTVELRSTDAGNPSRLTWNGHTINISSLVHQRIQSTSSIPMVIDESYTRDPNCEQTVNNLASRGLCVTIVFQITSAANQKIGYKLANDRRCLIPNDSEPIFVPRQPTRITAFLSHAKDWLGLLDQSVPTETAHNALN